MSDKKRHNVKAYLEACGMYKKVTEEMNPNIIINLMEGYAQLYHNNQRSKANDVELSQEKALHKHIVSVPNGTVCSTFKCDNCGAVRSINGCNICGVK